MAKVISQLPSGGSVPKHDNLLGLNEGDYLHLTQFEKAKLDGIQSGAEVNVNADWNAISGDAQILNKPVSFPPSTHTHVISDITGLQGELDNKLDKNNPSATGTLTLQTDPSILVGTFDILVRNPSSGVVSKVLEATYRKSSVDVPWTEVSGKPSTFPPSAHTHTVSQITDFPTFKTIENQSIIGAGNIDLDKASVGLGNVDNTSDLNKIISTATQTALNAKANISGQVFTGAVSATNLSGTNTGDNAPNSLYSGLVTNATHTGEVTGSTALTITNGAVTNAKLANVATSTLKGRVSAATGVVEDLTASQVRTLLNVANGANNYVHPANHLASIITQDASNRFVTDTEKSAWNAKEPAIASGTISQYWRGDKTWQPFPAQATVDQTIIDGSTNAVSSNAVFDGLALKSNKADFINIKDLGGIGDGVFDNTTIVNNALLTYKEVYFPDGNYLVTSLVNDLGSKITGSGIIVKAIAGGTQQLNTGIDRYNYVFGQEYLSAFQKVIIARGGNNGITAKVSWSGDSTTAGDGITDGAYLLSNLFKATANVNGIANITSLNRGHSGANTEQWRTLYLADDLAENPDLYIIRWGINDPGWLKNGTTPPLDSGDTYPNRRDISDFETSLRTALSTIRASKSQSEMSIILMSPNGTSDTPNGRDEKWYEQVKKVYIKAARDYKCAFIDTYSLWLDSRGAAGLYMDDPFSDGRAIHPLNIMNTWIVSKVFDLVFPESLKTMVSGGYLNNESSVDRLPLVSDLPETYRKGQTISRSYVAGAGVETQGNWSVDGTVSTIFNIDGSGYQFNTSRLTNNPAIYFRTFKGEYLSEALSWSNTVKLWHSGNDAVFPKLANVNLFTNKMRISGGGVSTSISDVNTTATHIVDVANTAISLATGYVGSDDVFLQSFNNSSKTSKSLILNPFGGDIIVGGNLSASNYTGGATLIGTPTAPTAPAGTNTTQIATTAFVQANTRPYKVYTALLTQTGTNAPVAIVLENTLGGAVVWSRTGVGTYTGTLTGAFVANKTIGFQGGNLTAPNSMVRITTGINNIQITTNTSTATADNLLGFTSIEIRVYN